DDGWGCPFKVLTGVIGQGEGFKPTHPQAEALTELLIEGGADPFDAQALYNTSIVGDDVSWTERLWRHCEARGETGRWQVVGVPGLGGRIQTRVIDYLLGNAVTFNHLRRCGWLLDHGADPNALHAYRAQPVHTVARLC